MLRIILGSHGSSTHLWVKTGVNLRSTAPPLIGGDGAVLVQVGTHRRHCNAVPRKIFGGSGVSILRTGETPVTRHPSTPPSKAPPASRAHPRFNGSDGLLCRRIDRNARRVP
jgi:hypothetical protein